MSKYVPIIILHVSGRIQTWTQTCLIPQLILFKVDSHWSLTIWGKSLVNGEEVTDEPQVQHPVLPL